MYVVIAGGGRTGSQLAGLLIAENYQVRLIEHRPEILARLHRELPTEVIYEGDPVYPHVLGQVRLSEADVFVAATADDATNLVVCYLARSLFHVPRIISRINNPQNAWLFDDSFHIDVALNQANVLAHLIQEEMSLGDMMTLLKLRRGEYSLVEEKVPPGAKAIGIPLRDLGLPDQCVIASIIRKGTVTLPRGDSTFQEGDEVLAVTNLEGARQLAALLSPPEEDQETRT